MARYRRNAGATFSLKYHLVWCPKYRRPVLTPPHDVRLKEIFAEVATEADMIVHATHGRTGLSHLLMGSVAERVLRTAPCPVLTLRSDVAKRAVRKKAPAK